jgi:tetratricopeptide (TPR) repeat protein
MRRLVLAFALFALAGTAVAADLLGPAEYMKILGDSKLRYNFLTTPSATPAEPMRCPRRDESTRVERNGKEKSLVAWNVKPEARQLLQEGETLFQKKDYAAAAEKYKAAIAADPQAVTGYYVLGDALLFGSNDAAAALEQYRKGLALDPTMPSGHLFAQTALVHLGRTDEAREEIIKALVYYPGYEVVWKSVNAASYDRWKVFPIVRHKFDPPAGFLGTNGKNGVDIYGGPNGEWLGYAMCKAAWGNEARFKKQHGAGGWSLEEERACVMNQVMTAYNTAAAKLEEQKKNASEEQILAAMPPLETHILEVAKAQLLDGYILFEIIGQNCPLALSIMDDEALKEEEAYVRRFVIVAR